MKRKKRRDEHISPNSLIVPAWSMPIPKEEKRVSIISTVICAICIILMKIDISYPALLEVIIVFATPISLVLSFVAPVSFFVNKLLQKMHNEEARQEMLAREKEWNIEDFEDDEDLEDEDDPEDDEDYII